jgi:hypothetical protein
MSSPKGFLDGIGQELWETHLGLPNDGGYQETYSDEKIMIDPWGLWGSLFSDPDITGCNCS